MDEAFESAEVKELGARADKLKVDDTVALLRHVQRSLDAKLLTAPPEAWKGYDDLRGRRSRGGRVAGGG